MYRNEKQRLEDEQANKEIVYAFISMVIVVLIVSIYPLLEKKEPVYCDIIHSKDLIIKDVDLSTIKAYRGHIEYKHNGNYRIYSVPSGYAVLCK